MANCRYINTEFWEDNYIAGLTRDGRYLWLYLLTNPATNIAGAYQIKLKRIALDTDLSVAEIEQLLQTFERDQKIFYKDGWVYLANFIKHQTRSPKVITGMKSILYNAPKWIQDRVSIGYPELEIPYRYPIAYNRIECNRKEENETAPAIAVANSTAYTIYREFFPKYQLGLFQTDLLQTAEINEAEFRECLTFWASHGYAEKNIGGLIDCYNSKNYKPKPTKPETKPEPKVMSGRERAAELDWIQKNTKIIMPTPRNGTKKNDNNQ